MNSALRWYLISTGLYLIPGGIQQVIFPWLIAVYLAETSERLGFAQMASQIPMILLLLWGGLLGDLIDQRRLLIRLQLAMALPALGMAALFFYGYVHYELLIGWAIIGATLGAFAQPARDALLNRVAGNDIQRVVTLAVGIQFGIQIIGFLIGSTAERLGPSILLIGQAMLMIFASIATSRIPPLPPMEKRLRRHPIKEIGEGLSYAWHSELIRPTIFLTSAIGIFFAGSYLVILPIMVRDIYQGGALGIALTFGINMLGTVTTIVYLMRRGGIERTGRSLILISTLGALILSILYFDLPYWGFFAVVYCWGMCGGVSMSISRAIVQEAAPSTHRARLMSVYSLGMMGGMPIGSLLLGWCVGRLGVQEAILIPVIGMIIVQCFLLMGSGLWQIRRKALVPSTLAPGNN